MVIQFTLQDILIFLAAIIGIVIGILLISTLWKVNKVVGTMRSLLETNQESINKSVSAMPGILENVGQITVDARETTGQLKNSVPLILQEVESVTNAAKGSIEMVGSVIENVGTEINHPKGGHKGDSSGFLPYLHIVEEVLQIVYRIVSSKK